MTYIGVQAFALDPGLFKLACAEHIKVVRDTALHIVAGGEVLIAFGGVAAALRACFNVYPFILLYPDDGGERATGREYEEDQECAVHGCLTVEWRERLGQLALTSNQL